MQSNHEPLSASLEDYLEAIFQIIRSNHVARAREIGRRLNVRRSSVTGALYALAERGLVNYAPYDLITLTEKGEQRAREVVQRHEALREFFVRVLRVEAEEADVAACRLEHAISDAILERLIAFVEYVDRCPEDAVQWIREHGYRCEWNGASGCRDCVGASEESTGGTESLP